MYNESLKVANKIITDQDLGEIFSKMHEECEKYQKQAKYEIQKNSVLSYSYQTWTMKEYRSVLTFDVDFTDSTNIRFDNYVNFSSIYNTRLSEIKRIIVNCGLHYYVKNPGDNDKYFHPSIYMVITEKQMEIDVHLSSEEDKLIETFRLIKDKILNAPIKYDNLVSKREKIISKITFGYGVTPAIIIATLLTLIPFIKDLYVMSYIGYPLLCLILSYLIGGLMLTGKLERLYASIRPESKFDSYDVKRDTYRYVDNIDEFLESSEIMIGKNHANTQKREEIINLEKKYSKKIPIGIIIIIIITIIIIALLKQTI